MSEELISKEETMFRIDANGKAIAEKFPIKLYPRDLDRELIEEGMLLMSAIKRNKVINKAIAVEVAQQNNHITELKNKIEQELDEPTKRGLQLQLAELIKAKIRGDVQTTINCGDIEEGISSSREIINKLNAEKEKLTVIKYVELIPCNTSEAYLAFEKNLTTTGENTSDWVADLITKHLFNPKYTLEEAKMLKSDYKVALKEAIMEASNYKVQSFRDIMTSIKMLEETPLQVKKD